MLMERRLIPGAYLSLTLPIKMPVADFAPFQNQHPGVSRSSLVRALIYACASAEQPLPSPDFEPPRLSAWTTVAIDPSTEILLQHVYEKNNVSNVSALIYAAVRDAATVKDATAFLRRHPIEQKKLATKLARTLSGFSEDAEEDEEIREIEDGASLRLERYLVSEVSRTEEAVKVAIKAHTAAKSALASFFSLRVQTTSEV